MSSGPMKTNGPVSVRGSRLYHIREKKDHQRQSEALSVAKSHEGEGKGAEYICKQQCTLARFAKRISAPISGAPSVARESRGRGRGAHSNKYARDPNM